MQPNNIHQQKRWGSGTHRAVGGILTLLAFVFTVVGCGQPDSGRVGQAAEGTPTIDVSPSIVPLPTPAEENYLPQAQPPSVVPSIDAYLAAGDQEIIAAYRARLQRTDLSVEERRQLEHQLRQSEQQAHDRAMITPLPEDYGPGEQEQIASFLQEVASGKYDPETQQHIGAKLAFVERDARDRAIARTRPQKPKYRSAAADLAPAADPATAAWDYYRLVGTLFCRVAHHDKCLAK